VEKVNTAQRQEPISIFFPEQKKWRFLGIEEAEGFVKAKRIEGDPVNFFLCKDLRGRGGGRIFRVR
jgi:hypothetical protein